jgi:hypothetical protein
MGALKDFIVVSSAGVKDTYHWEVPKSIRQFTIQQLTKVNRRIQQALSYWFRWIWCRVF